MIGIVNRFYRANGLFFSEGISHFVRDNNPVDEKELGRFRSTNSSPRSRRRFSERSEESFGIKGAALQFRRTDSIIRSLFQKNLRKRSQNLTFRILCHMFYKIENHMTDFLLKSVTRNENSKTV
jgi:hypothetical protein